jgi:hypothetical protein
MRLRDMNQNQVLTYSRSQCTFPTSTLSPAVQRIPHDQTLRSRIEDSTEITLPLLGFDECISSLAPPSIHRQLLELYPIIHYFVIRAVRIPPTTA